MGQGHHGHDKQEAARDTPSHASGLESRFQLDCLVDVVWTPSEHELLRLLYRGRWTEMFKETPSAWQGRTVCLLPAFGCPDLTRNQEILPGWNLLGFPGGSVGKKERKESEVAQSCLTHCDPTDCSPAGFSVHGIFQARVLEWAAISSPRVSSQPRDQTWVSRIVGRCFTI